MERTLINIPMKSHRFTFKGQNIKKNKSPFCFSDGNGAPNRKADTICDSDIVVHLSASVRAAAESSSAFESYRCPTAMLC